MPQSWLGVEKKIEFLDHESHSRKCSFTSCTTPISDFPPESLSICGTGENRGGQKTKVILQFTKV